MIHYDLPYADYRAHEALGSTDLKNILKNPAFFRHARANQKKSKALEFGTALHAYLLERKTFFDIFTVEPEGLINKAKNPWKKEWELFKEEHADKEIVTQKDWKAIKGIERNIKNHPFAAPLLEESRYEVSCFGDTTKARADILHDGFIGDLKTCEDSEEFVLSIQEYKYYMQSAMYLDVFEQFGDGRPRQFAWIICEKTEPYCVRVDMPSDIMLERGRRQYKRAVEIYKRCVEKDEWPGYATDIRILDLKPWYRGGLES